MSKSANSMGGRSSLTAERCYREALTAIRVGNFKSAADLFRQTLDIERRAGESKRSARCLSYYGLCLAKQGHSRQMAVEACRKALSKEPGDPLMHLNLGHTYSLCGRTVAAIKAYQHGLARSPSHEGLRRALDRIDRRSPPVIGLLPRSHPLNRWLGLKVRSGQGKRPKARPI